MRRRDFLSLLGGAAAAWPLASRAQAGGPLIGFLNSRSPEDAAPHAAAFLQGLKAFGYVDGQTATVEYRWARGDYGRLPALAKELVSLNPAVIIATGGTPSARAAQLASSSIPIVFVSGDPIADRLVASLSRPGGNSTGVGIMSGELGGKRFELIAQLVPDADVLALLNNPQDPGDAVNQTRDVQAAAQKLAKRLIVIDASIDAELKKAFARISESGAKAVVVQNDPYFDSRRDRLIALAAERRVAAIYHIREFPAEGGLMSYGASLVSAYQQAGVQAGRILKGANVADLPVMQPTRFELVINLKTAAALGLVVPPGVLAQADEVIE
jgi:putative ABC transport system substrate-binding protein